jgi:tetratricopeptide (TPR) repeat protein
MRLWVPVLTLLAAACRVADGDPALADARLQERRLRELQEAVLAQRASGRDEEALATLRRMATLAPGHPRPYELAARLHAAPPRFDEAEAFMRSLGSSGPGLSFGLAQIDYYEGDYEAALARLDVALGGYRGDPAGEAFCHKSIGLSLSWSERLDESEEALAAARRSFERVGDEAAVADMLNHLAAVARKRERYPEAIALYREALAIQERIGDRRGQGTTWRALGGTLRHAGEADEAVAAFEHAIELYRRIGDKRDLYQSLRQLSEAYFDLDEEQAVAPLREAAVLAADFGAREWACWCRQRAGLILSEHGHHDEAAQELALAREVALATGDEKLRAKVEEDAAVILVRAGRYAAAAEQGRVAADLAAQARLAVTEGAALTTRALALVSLGQLTDALLAQERALEACRSARRQASVVKALNNLALIHRSLGHPDVATSRLEEGLAIARELLEQDPQDRVARDREALALHGIATLSADAGRIEQALEAQRKALEAWASLNDPRYVAHASMSVADLLWKLDRREEARDQLERALAGFREVAKHSGEAAALTLRGKFDVAAGAHEEALASCTAALEIAQSRGLAAETRDARALLGTIHEAMGRPAQALEEYARAVELIEAQRLELASDEFRMRFFASTAHVFERATNLQAALEADTDGAPATFRLVERARARSLAELLSEAAAGLRESIPEVLSERELALIDRVSAATVRLVEARDAQRREAERALADAEDELRRFKIELRRRAPAYAHATYPEPVGLEELGRLVLRPDETLLRYYLADDGTSLVWVVDQREARVFRLPRSTKEIEALVGGYLDRVGRADAGLAGPAGAAEAESLSAALLVEQPRPGQRLIVVPDGALHRLPFESLRREGRYLIEDHEIVVVPSATVLQRLRESGVGPAGDGFLGVGDPVAGADDSAFPQLPWSGRSLEQIASRFPEGARTLLRGEACTRERLRAQPLRAYRFVHFATHGWLDPRTPRRIGLRLSPAAPDGPAGFLYVEDVFPMELSAELVVLSACQSGLGELLPGEGLAGLTRAFLYAGTRSVLVSLWPVDDRPTAEFMETLYAQLEGTTVATALRRTKLAFIASERAALRQPHAWAAFVLVGDPSPEPQHLNPSLVAAGAARQG